MSEDKQVTLKLSQDEALVLYEWLKVREDESEKAGYTEAELRSPELLVLWELEAQLDCVLSEPFLPNYAALLEGARERIVALAYGAESDRRTQVRPDEPGGG